MRRTAMLKTASFISSPLSPETRLAMKSPREEHTVSTDAQQTMLPHAMLAQEMAKLSTPSNPPGSRPKTRTTSST